MHYCVEIKNNIYLNKRLIEKAKRIRKLFKKYLIERKTRKFQYHDLNNVVLVCIMAARSGEVDEWLKSLPC